MGPFKLTPSFKDYIWGGTRLRTDFNKKCGYEKIAESWELSCHKDGISIVASGEFAGRTLAEYISLVGKSVLGTDCERFKEFPVLIKLIDAKDNLSVQVHPDNDYAMRVEGEYGKTEMWYIADCDEGASLIYGFKDSISRSEFEERIRENTLLEVTNKVPVHKGDVFFIEAGTLHAIGKGIVIAEIQQNSNTTYRVYDYGRIDKNGSPRELNIDKAAEVTRLSHPDNYSSGEWKHSDGFSEKNLASCEYFKVSEAKVKDSAVFNADNTSFDHLLILEGKGELICENKSMQLEKGDSIFIPAGTGRYTVSGCINMLITRI